MVKRKVAALEKLDADLPSLQYKIRRDPRSYRDDFLRQWEQYESQREIFLISPATATPDSVESFRAVINLIAHVADCYPDETRTFAHDLRTILSQHHAALHPDLRDRMVGALSQLRRRDLISSSDLLTTLFPVLVASPSKTLRALLFAKILGDLRAANARATNHPLNRTVQTVLLNLVTADRTSPSGLWAVKLTRELWKRRVWADVRPVEVMKETCLSENEKVIVAGVRFFLGGDQDRAALEEGGHLEDASSDEEAVDLQKMRHQMGINKKTKKKAGAYRKAVEKVRRDERKKNKKLDGPGPVNFSALHLLHDPQGFAESLFAKHLRADGARSTAGKLSLDSRLLVLQLVTRLVGMHKLTMLGLYSWFAKHLTPRHQSVTVYLACLAQATHDQVPPDAIEPLVIKIANEFVSEGSACEVSAAGLNAIRETCARQPLAMTDTLLQDLVQYRKSKDKGVVMAARGLLSLYRHVGPDLLRRRDRGRDAAIARATGPEGEAARRQRRFGEETPGGIEGLELLERWKAEEAERKRRAGDGKDGDRGDDDSDGWRSGEWEVASDDSGGSGEWIDVSQGEEEGPPASKRQKLLSLGKSGAGKEEEGDGGADERAGSESSEWSNEEEDDDEDGSEDDEEAAGSDDEDESEDEEADEEAGSENGGTGEREVSVAGPSAATAAASGAAGEGGSNVISNLATTSILTPADLAKLHELRIKAGIEKAMSGGKTNNSGSGGAGASGRHLEDGLTAEQIELPAKLRRPSTKEERVALAREGRPDRDEHKSTQAIRRSRKEAAGKSTTNREKARRKNMFMTLGKAKAKQKRSLAATSRILRGHVERAKRGGRRGNKG